MKFTCWFISLVALAALGADLSSAEAVRGLRFAQDENQASQSPGELARMLAGQAKVLSVPAKGKAKRRLDKKEKHFALPYGESPVVLFKLPDYASPYFLRVKSLCRCSTDFKKAIFVPSGILLNPDFQETRRIDEADLKVNAPGWTTPLSMEATVEMNDARKSNRYLLIYTRGDRLGTNVTSERMGGALPGALGIRISVSRIAFGDVEVEVASEKRK